MSFVANNQRARNDAKLVLNLLTPLTGHPCGLFFDVYDHTLYSSLKDSGLRCTLDDTALDSTSCRPALEFRAGIAYSVRMARFACVFVAVRLEGAV